MKGQFSIIKFQQKKVYKTLRTKMHENIKD